MAFTIDKGSLQLLALFEQVTHAAAKDTFEDAEKNLTFVVNSDQMAKAIGKQGSTLRRLEQRLKRHVRVIEYDEVLETFIRNIAGVDNFDIRLRNDIVTLVPYTLQVRGKLIGRAAYRLRNMEAIVQRYFPVRKIVVTNVQELPYTA